MRKEVQRSDTVYDKKSHVVEWNTRLDNIETTMMTGSFKVRKLWKVKEKKMGHSANPGSRLLTENLVGGMSTTTLSKSSQGKSNNPFRLTGHLKTSLRPRTGPLQHTTGWLLWVRPCRCIGFIIGYATDVDWISPKGAQGKTHRHCLRCEYERGKSDAVEHRSQNT